MNHAVVNLASEEMQTMNEETQAQPKFNAKNLLGEWEFNAEFNIDDLFWESYGDFLSKEVVVADAYQQLVEIPIVTQPPPIFGDDEDSLQPIHNPTVTPIKKLPIKRGIQVTTSSVKISHVPSQK